MNSRLITHIIVPLGLSAGLSIGNGSEPIDPNYENMTPEEQLAYKIAYYNMALETTDQTLTDLKSTLDTIKTPQVQAPTYQYDEDDDDDD
ncbi:MAG: hypothetical protein AAF585_25250, partial [Verrucomicrobiota bacterium]